MANSIQKLFFRVHYSNMTFSHTTDILRHQGLQKNYERPSKVVKVKPKARESTKPKF
jgi:hypothetical protein